MSALMMTPLALLCYRLEKIHCGQFAFRVFILPYITEPGLQRTLLVHIVDLFVTLFLLIAEAGKGLLRVHE